MNPEIYSEWLRRQGQTVIRTASSYWHSEALGIYQAFPYHWLISPDRTELSDLFARGAVGLRYSMSSDCVVGCPSYGIVFEGSEYGFDNLGHRTRKNVRRGLQSCTVEPITFPELVDQAWDVRRDALDRQRRHLNITPESWKEHYLTAEGLSGFQAWAARVGSELAGYLVTFQMNECLCIIDHQSHRKFLNLNVNNAMTFVVSQDAVKKPGVKLLFYGLESLDAPPRVSEFKFHMGYTAKPIRQRVVFRPQLAPFANRWTYKLVSAISGWRPSDRRFSKAKGMLRLSLAEKIPSIS